MSLAEHLVLDFGFTQIIYKYTRHLVHFRKHVSLVGYTVLKH